MAAGKPDPIRAELFFGAVYGLGLSSLIWSSVLFPPTASGKTLALMALVLSVGLLRPSVSFLGRCSPVLPVAESLLSVTGLLGRMLSDHRLKRVDPVARLRRALLDDKDRVEQIERDATQEIADAVAAALRDQSEEA